MNPIMLTHLAPASGAGDTSTAAKADTDPMQQQGTEQDQSPDFATVLAEAEIKTQPKIQPAEGTGDTPLTVKPPAEGDVESAGGDIALAAKDADKATAAQTREATLKAETPAAKTTDVRLNARRNGEAAQLLATQKLGSAAQPTLQTLGDTKGAQTPAPILQTTAPTTDADTLQAAATTQNRTLATEKQQAAPKQLVGSADLPKPKGPIEGAPPTETQKPRLQNTTAQLVFDTKASTTAAATAALGTTGTPQHLEGVKPAPIKTPLPEPARLTPAGRVPAQGETAKSPDLLKPLSAQPVTDARPERPQPAITVQEAAAHKPMPDKLQPLPVLTVSPQSERRINARTLTDAAPSSRDPAKAPAPQKANPATPLFAANAEALTPVASQSQLSPLSAIAEGDPLILSRTDATTGAPTQSTTTQPMRMDLPHHVSRQVAEALQNMPSRPVEISLNPEELGRVRLGVSSSEAGIVVSVLAERPETIDLMRRHINNLEAAFQAIGYSDISFSFAGGDAQNDGDTNQQTGTTAQLTDGLLADSTDSQTIHLQTQGSAGLDLRL